MTHVARSGRAFAMKDVLRNPVGTLRAEVDLVGQRARDGLRSALESGSATLRHLDRALASVSELDWTVGGLRRRVVAFRKDGLFRLQTLRTRTLERLDALPGEAITALAAAGRTRVQELERGMGRAAKRLAPPASVPRTAPERAA
ncbi:MAG TPA: hypothetical protein VLU43_01450 [Anaeromyxobacteraceae bacterium]|nr:hypothetical protein [Anaeromyxobacteraceae bacterium]